MSTFFKVTNVKFEPYTEAFFFFLMSDFKLTLEASLLSSWRKEREP